MTDEEPDIVIPLDRLPPGFAERLDAPGPVADPKPAATAVLVRDGARAPEILLLKRLRSAGFVPGAFVFPGGRVDTEDAHPELARLLGLVPRGADAAYWLAAVREVFEETGVLLARGTADDPEAAGAADPDGWRMRLREWRERLLTGAASLHDMFGALRLRPDISRMVYCSHWITPVAEPKRYDTRFFLAALPEGAEVSIDAREMSDAVWVTAADAIERFRRGALPMVFPTVKTIQMLQPYRAVGDMLTAFRDGEVPAVLPRLVRTPEGVGIVLPDNE
jgi:8-oxo-dGTP pyrophosphatase MutT (NUDIX family)